MSVINSYPNFKSTERQDYHSIKSDFIQDHVIKKGVPLVISKTTSDWNTEIFTPTWIKEHYSNLEITVRIDGNLKNTEHWTVGKYIDYLNRLNNSNSSNSNSNNNNISSSNTSNNNNSNSSIYGSNNNINNNGNPNSSFYYRKDIPCPPEWNDFIDNKIHTFLREKGEGDLVSDLPNYLQPSSTHMGIDGGDYWSPGHREVAGSVGYNLMVYNGGVSKTFWFCTSSQDIVAAEKFWKEKNNAVIDNDAKQMFISLEELSRASFPIYFIEQNAGDLVILPPGSIYQYFNYGGQSLKLTWNRMAVDHLEQSYKSIIPMYRTIRKKQHFPVKSMIYHSLLKKIIQAEEYQNDLNNSNNNSQQQFLYDFSKLINLFDHVLWSERIDISVMEEQRKSSDESVSNYNETPNRRLCFFL